MKYLNQKIKKKWIISIGIIALIILIWFGGPLLGIGNSLPLNSPVNRLLVILFILGIWLYNNSRYRFKLTKASPDANDILTSESLHINNENLENINVLQQGFEEAIKYVKSLNLQKRLFGGKQYLYKLPWYMIIGPSGSGKTTLLDNAGLEFSPNEHKYNNKLSDIESASHCDWWFTNDAILLDTAGRYTTQDSDEKTEDDEYTWNRFLELLKNKRTRRPLNGIIIIISVDIILNSPQHIKDFHAEAIRKRVQEIYTKFNIRIPVYLLLTKLDKVSGFAEFFDTLDEKQRDQVWGMTFPQENTEQHIDIINLFNQDFDALINSLNSHQLWRMHQERDLLRRNLINNYPQEMANIKPKIDNFLKTIFKTNRSEQRAFLRGIYLTSGIQQIRPNNEEKNNLSSAIEMERHYFIRSIFKKIIFKESEIGGTNIHYEKQQLWLKRAVYLSTMGITFFIISTWATAFIQIDLQALSLNKNIDNYQNAIKSLHKKTQYNKISNALDAAKEINLTYANSENSSNWHLGMGSYQRYKIKSSVDDAYFFIQQQIFLPYIKQKLEEDMKDISQKPENLHRLLSAYLMLGNPETLDPKIFKSSVIEHWKKRLNKQPKKLARLNLHLEELLQTEYHPLQLNQNLINKTQKIVCQIPLSDQIYARLNQQAETSIKVYNLFRLNKNTRKILTPTKHEVPGFYTYDGYHDIFIKEGVRTAKLTITENINICKNDVDSLALANPEKLLLNLEARYFEDYINYWNQFISQIKLLHVANINEAVDMLNSLSKHESPLEDIIRAITEQTVLERAQIKGLLDYFELGKKLSKPSNPVELAFSPLHKLLLDKNDKPAEISDIKDELKNLYEYVSEISASSDQSTVAFDIAESRMGQTNVDIIRLLRRNARNLPAPVSEIVKSASTQTWGTILGSARSYINTVWQTNVLKEYKASLKNRYPVFKEGRQQAALADFGHFFGASGSVDNFINTYLKPFIDKRRWRLRTIDGHNLGLSSDVMTQIQRAMNIRKMYFQDGGQQPSVHFQLKPISLDAEIKRFLLEFNAQQTTYQHGPSRSVKFEWPGTEDNDQVRMVFERFGTGRYSIVQDGPWAWFKLLDNSIIKKYPNRDKIQVTFNTAGLKTRYQIQATSVVNPFSNNELAKFRCPPML